MRKTFLLFILLMSIGIGSLMAQSKEKVTYFIIKTDYGQMKGFLYNETPKHRDNFVKLASERFYDNIL